MKGYLVLENGDIFEGEKIGYNKECLCEVVFNTSMAGYLEAFTDPAYKGQGICMTYPLIGNYGTISKDYENGKLWLEAIFIHELEEFKNDVEPGINLNDILIKNEIPGLTDINTRKLTKLLRTNGTMKGMLTADISNKKEILEKIKNYKLEINIDEISTKEKYKVGDGDIKIALMDYGSKEGIIKSLTKRGCEITVFPSKSKEIIKEEFDGIVLTGGAGNPEDYVEEIEIIKELYKKDIPILGIALGHQLMGLATGSKTGKLKFGHRGGNQPVKDLKKDKIYITSQNHGYYIKEETLNKDIAEISHINVHDKTIEGLRYKGKDILTVQFHPEACPGPQDSQYIFDEFIETIKKQKRVI